MTFRFPALLLVCACSTLLTMSRVRGEDAALAPASADREHTDAQPGVKKTEDAWKAQVMTALKRKVTFEFVTTPFNEAIAFLQSISRANIVVRPNVPSTQEITLKVSDTPIEEALTLICNLNGAEWKLQNQAIVIDLTEAALAEQRAAEAKEAAERAAAQQAAASVASRLRIKFANGVELEAEGSALQQLALRDDIQNALFDPAKDGLLCVQLPAAYSEAQLDEVRRVCAEIAPKVKLDFNAKLQVLLASGDDARELRRVATLLRQLKSNSEKAPVKP